MNVVKRIEEWAGQPSRAEERMAKLERERAEAVATAARAMERSRALEEREQIRATELLNAVADLVDAEKKLAIAYEWGEQLRVERDKLTEAIEDASYYLNPNQGETPDPGMASMILRSTWPEDHPNHVSRETLAKFGFRSFARRKDE